jgi:copper(I)-binding protein
MDFATRTADLHNGADQAMALDLKATLEEGKAFPVTPRESMEAGLTVMAIDEAAASGQTVDCAPMWAELDEAARGAAAPQDSLARR